MPLLAPSPMPPAAKVWFRTVVPTLLGLLALYLFLHSNNAPAPLQKAREEIVSLSKPEFEAVVSLLDEGTNRGDTATAANQAEFAIRKEKVFAYLLMRYTFRDKGERMRQDLVFFNTRAELRTALTDYPLRVKSYFWLADTWIYTEILFWSIFGVLASLLYSVSEALREGKAFDRSEVPSHWAKLAYTPFSVLIIYLSINLFGESSLNNVAFSAWQIVLAFVLGFFSRRTMDLLDRVKELIFPLGRDPKSSGGAGATRGGGNGPVNPPPAGTSFSITGTVHFDATVPTPPLDALPQTRLDLMGDAGPVAQGHPGADGTFRFDSVEKGSYSIMAQLIHPTEGTFTGMVEELTVDGQDPSPVDVPLSPAG
ncbi:MAG: hypothetical protein H7Y12_09725 [Sphingobacteriaceae bacterium]|nr:hypothetical protein [Cytophagaceae bacterium]